MNFEHHRLHHGPEHGENQSREHALRHAERAIRHRDRDRSRGNPGRRHEFDFGNGGEFWGGLGPGRHGGHGGHVGHGEHGDRRERLERGLLRYIILDVLKDGPMHGYEIIKRLEEGTGNQYAPSPGTLYPTLQYLDDLGFIKADQGTERKTYNLTDEGKAELEGHAEVVKHFWGRFADRTPDDVSRHELRFLHDALNDLVRTVRTGVHSVMSGGDPDTIRRIRQSLEKSQNKLREIIANGTDRVDEQEEAETGAETTSQRREPSEF